MTQPYLVALPPDLAATFPPYSLGFSITQDSTGLDMTTVTSARARLERPDHSVVEWLLVKGAATSSMLATTYSTAPGDFADLNGHPLPGTYTIRFFVTAPGGERPMGEQTFVVDPYL